MVFHIRAILDQLPSVYHIYARASDHKHLVIVVLPDVIVVKIWEVIQYMDLSVFIHIAQAVAGNDKNAVTALILDRAQHNAGA